MLRFSTRCFISKFLLYKRSFCAIHCSSYIRTNVVNLPYINVDRIGRIAAYAPEPNPKIAKRIMRYNILPTTPKHTETRQPMPALRDLAGCSSFHTSHKMKPTIGMKNPRMPQPTVPPSFADWTCVDDAPKPPF